jgi:putative PIN family toxin of toxin-antitoxin system
VKLILSEHILSELTRALNDRYFRERRSPASRAHYIEEIRMIATIVTPDVNLHGVATHPEDDVVLATAVAGQADFLCTRDRQLLNLRQVQGIVIVSPGELLSLLPQP